jgi:glycogen operon protein
MILSGDEFCNSQMGNNNAYCQDNKISWLDWNNLEENKDVFEFFKRIIAFRKEHPVMRRKDFYTGMNSSGYPELSFHGKKSWKLDAPFHTFGFMYAETVKDHNSDYDCFIYCGINTHWEERSLELPIIPKGMKWYREVYTFDDNLEEEQIDGGSIVLAPRSLMLLTAK